MYLKNYRQLENLHILFWLFKDACWMMEFKVFGVFMILPTVLMALWILWTSRPSLKRFLPNLAVFFWIMANANWMVGEFYQVTFMQLSIILFALGVSSITVYLYLILPTSKPRQ